MREFKLPSLGADMEQGKLLEWKVKPGDHVKRGDIIAVVDTQKAAIDVEIWEEGIIYELLVQPEETVPVGAVLATLLEPGEIPDRAKQKPLAEKAPSQSETVIRPQAPVPVITPAVAKAQAAPIKISPAARRRAQELSVDIGKLSGSGPDGAITLTDVENAAPMKTQAEDRQAQMRKAIAAAMTRSKREIPHYYLSHRIPLDKATAWLQAENARRPISDRLLMSALLLKATALAVTQFPEMNGFWAEGEFKQSAPIHLGIAISLRQGGLIAPAIHHADQKPLGELMKALSDLVMRTRAGSLKSSEISDPTITVTNLGDQGVDSVFGVIHPPQVAMVGFGKVSAQPWVINDAVHAIPLVIASVSADHRVSDGHRGALFLARISDLLQQPAQL